MKNSNYRHKAAAAFIDVLSQSADHKLTLNLLLMSVATPFHEMLKGKVFKQSQFSFSIHFLRRV